MRKVASFMRNLAFLVRAEIWEENLWQIKKKKILGNLVAIN